MDLIPKIISCNSAKKVKNDHVLRREVIRDTVRSKLIIIRNNKEY